jgi:hypothetical protein
METKGFNFENKDFLHNPIVQWVFIASIFVNLASWIFMIIFIRPVDYPIILHYNVYFGVDLIGAWWQAYFLPAIGTFLLIFNFGLSKFIFEKKERIAAYILLLAAFIIQAGTAIAIASVILINY